MPNRGGETTQSRSPSVCAFAPGTVANVSAGFDVLAFAIEGPGDRVAARRVSEPGIRLAAVTGDDGSLPRSVAENTAGIAAQELLRRAGLEAAAITPGIELRLEKGLPLNSGLGSSAASAVAAAVAVDALLGTRFDRIALLQCAMAAEKAAVGFGHADNAAASLFGGVVLVRGSKPPRVDPVPAASGLCAAVVRPHWKVNTGEARAVIPKTLPVAAAVIQAGNLAALVLGLTRGDHDLIASAVIDVIAEPHRTESVPRYDAMIQAARKAGALGAGLSGSGPSVYALCGDPETAARAAAAMRAAYGEAECEGYVTPLNAQGARIESGSPAADT
jgi:homoserine kinase